MGDRKTVMEQLRAATRGHHQRLESLAFAQALAQGTLPLHSYVGYLRAMAVIHGVLEGELSRSKDPAVMAVWKDSMRKLPLLMDDLDSFASQLIGDVPGAVVAAVSVADAARLRSAQDPISLLGYIYVLEGATRGATVLRPLAAAAFGLTGPGLAYLTNYGDRLDENWAGFTARMNASVDDSSAPRVVAAACDLYDRVAIVMGNLHPADPSQLRFFATTLNPEAGTHVVPQDPITIRSAIRAGEMTWQMFPYYKLRYGDRGRRYCFSDSGYLATLINCEPSVVTSEVAWLGRVLSSRGMPQIMLETHISVLAQELIKDLPEQRQACEKLVAASRQLADARRAHLSDQASLELSAQFDAAVGPEWSARFPRTGLLLASAVADERSGMESGVASLVPHLVMPDRFPDTWIQAVHTTLKTARERANHASGGH